MRKIMFLLLLIPTVLLSQDEVSVTVSWNPNTESDLAGYKVYYGLASRDYVEPVDAGNVTEIKIPGFLRGKTYFFAVTAYDHAGNESEFSDEVSLQAPKAPINVKVSVEEEEQ